MGWLGAGLGFLLGRILGIGPLGILITTVIGSIIEERRREKKEAEEAIGDAKENELVFLAGMAAMMAKLAKVDGHISMAEIQSAERAFQRLGLTPEKREYCIRVFRKAKDDNHTIFEYADSFTSAQPNLEIREILYDILWDLALADGSITDAELSILRTLTRHLRINPFLFVFQQAKRQAHYRRSNDENSYRQHQNNKDDLDSAYATLGCDKNASNDELKKAYRTKAQKYHPDALQAQGLSEELMAKATEQMSRINAAWDTIKKERGI